MRLHRIAIFCFCFSLISSLAQAQTPPTQLPQKKTTTAPTSRPRLQTESQRIVYGSTSWNRNSKTIDSAYLFMRDAKSGRMAKILLDETEPDSSTFSGDFSIQWSQEVGAEPEVYIPPANLRAGEKGLAEFSALLKAGKVQRKPFVIRKGSDGRSIIEVYDTRDQAKKALDALKMKEQAEKAKVDLNKPAIDKAKLELAQQAEKAAMLAKLQAEAAQRESDRIRLEQIERQKKLNLDEQQKKMAASEKKRRQALANQKANEGMEAYKANDFTTAEAKFRESFELDPTNTGYYFQYGVALYRNEKLNDALVALKLATVKDDTELERKYYQGLIHYRLKELDPALALFRELKAQKHPVLSPSSAFYEGVILFNKEDFEKAKASFEFVIDNSNDSKLDNKAEEMIDKCSQAIAYQKDLKRRSLVNLSAGILYDSNILLQPDSAAIATDKGGLRLQATGTYDYRFIYKEKNEFLASAALQTLYSLNDDVSYVDPTVGTFSLPYAWKGVWNDQTYKLALAPGYEATLMNLDQSGSPELILGSMFLAPTLTLVGNSNRMAIYAFEVRNDDSRISSSVGDDDADSLKLTAKTTQMFFRDEAKKKAIIAGGGLVYNSAKGKNKNYNKVDLSVYYTQPFNGWEATWNAGLAVYYQNYPDASRTDTNMSALYTVTKPISETWSWSGTLNYEINSSDDSSSEYNKYSATLSAIYNTGF